MSIEITLRIVCDNCGRKQPAVEESTPSRVAQSIWSMARGAETEGWMQIRRGGRHTLTHWCPQCADKPMKPVPRKKRVTESR